MPTFAQNVGNWNHLLALAELHGVGLFVNPPQPTIMGQGTFEAYFEGETTPSVSQSVTVADKEITVNTRMQGNSGKDLAIRFAHRSVTGGVKQLNPMLLTLNVRERNR